MKNGQCPKCGSQDVRSGVSIKEREKIVLHTGEGIWGPLRKLDQYVCVNCGYVETYLQEVEGLAYIAEHWPRVVPSDMASAQPEPQTDEECEAEFNLLLAEIKMITPQWEHNRERNDTEAKALKEDRARLKAETRAILASLGQKL